MVPTLLEAFRLRIRRTLLDAKAIAILCFRHQPPAMLCPCCGVESRFALYGVPPRNNAMCPNCLAMERHRLLAIFFQQRPEIFVSRRVLHIAPEAAIRRQIEPRAGAYTAGDLIPRPGDAPIDIEKLSFDDSSFDLVICSHVLEFVDDRAALLEMHRVLAFGGLLILMIPIIEGWERTFEDATIKSPRDRLLHFGDIANLRLYGRDLRNRIRAAGFRLNEFTAEEPQVSKHGLLRGEKLFLCVRS